MCLAVPAKILQRNSTANNAGCGETMMATVSIEGVTRQVSLMLLPEAQEGDYVLIHAGFAMQRIDEEEARQTLELFRELKELTEQEETACNS